MFPYDGNVDAPGVADIEEEPGGDGGSGKAKFVLSLAVCW